MKVPILALSLAVAASGVCRAESLYDAMQLAYQANPTLRSQRANLRASDEGYVQARAGYGPQVSVTGQIGYQAATVDQSVFGFSSTNTYRSGTASTDLSVVQPLYTAGRTTSQVRGAAAAVIAGREDLRHAESQLLQNVITAYVDVRRDREAVRILRDEIAALDDEFKEIKAKGDAGLLGKTDVAQAQARLLSARAQLNLSIGRLNASNAEYLEVVGQSPGELEPEPVLPGVPDRIDEALDAADHNNPERLSAIAAEHAAQQKVDQAKAENGPTVSLRMDAAVSPVEPYFQRQYDRSATVAVVVTQPLFTSGLNSSKVREAVERDNSAQLHAEAVRQGVVRQIAQAWAQLSSTKTAIDIQQQQIDAEMIAINGNRIEERVGLRSIIDLLNAELELANARLGLLQSRHDEYVARADLLASMGLLETRFLTPDMQAVRPEAHLKQVEGRYAPPWAAAVGLIDGAGKPSSHPTVSSDAEGAPKPSPNPEPSDNSKP